MQMRNVLTFPAAVFTDVMGSRRGRDQCDIDFFTPRIDCPCDSCRDMMYAGNMAERAERCDLTADPHQLIDKFNAEDT